MGKALSRRSPCCSKKNDREGYNEDGYIPQRSIYDTMCINEQIDHGSAHSTLGSRRGRETDFSSNGSLGGDAFEARSSTLLTGRRLDERFIFDSLKLANDELRSAGGFARSASPSVSCSSAPSGSVNKRHHHQDGGRKDSLCRHSWKVLAPPKLPEPLELSPSEKHFLNPGVAFFPNSMASPQISPFSGSPFSTGSHTPSVFFSPSPLPYHQQFHRQSLPTPTSQRPPFSELSVSALMCEQDVQEIRDKEFKQGVCMIEQRSTFETFKPRPVEPIIEPIVEPILKPIVEPIVKPIVEPISEQQPTTPEPETDNTPLLQPEISKSPRICTTSMESTWPRRLVGRRRTVRQGGAVHNLPILPPLPSLLIRSVSDKKPMPRLSPFPEHQGKVEGQLSKSLRKNELKECPLQDWRILREIEERRIEPSKNFEQEEVIAGPCSMPPVQENTEEDAAENTESEENWEAVLEMVNSLWDETWKDSDSQNLGSLKRWPLLHPPTGFGGSQAPSSTSSDMGAEDLLELERICRGDSIDSELDDLPQCLYDSQLKVNKKDVIVTQPAGHFNQVPSSLDLSAATPVGSIYGQSGSPDSNLTLKSDSSGVYMSNTSQTSKEDITSDGDRSVCELDCPYRDDNLPVEASKPEVNDHKQANLDQGKKSSLFKKAETKSMGSNRGSSGSLRQEVCTAVNTSKTTVPLPLSPSKHQIRETLLNSGDLDPFVTTDSFVYLAVSVPPARKTVEDIKNQTGPPALDRNELTARISFTKPGPYPDECDFLSTDSFVYLAAPDCHLLVAEDHSVYGDSDSEDSGSRADFVQPSTVGDSDFDSDLSDSDREWDYWEELEQDVLRGLFCEERLEKD